MIANLSSPSGDNGAANTIREIAQQPAVWRQVDRIVGESRTALDAFLRPLKADPDLRVVLTGAGTSAFAGEVLSTTLARRLGRRVDAISTTDLVADPQGHFAGDAPTLLVSFARSGDSPESVATTELAEQVLTTVHHLVITCNSEGHLARTHAGRPSSYVLLMPPESNDQGFAMTSSFTSMTLAALLALGGEAYEGVTERLARAAEWIINSDRADRAVAALVDREPERIVFLGSAALKGLAGESALKVLELNGGTVVTGAETSLGFRHGPKAVLNERTAVVVYLANDPYTRRYDMDIVAELRASHSPDAVVTVTSGSTESPDEGTSHNDWIVPDIGDVDDAALALPSVVYAQLIALRSALARGIRADNPFPSGEVNRVVQGVVLHPLHS
ncbi:SIS domain-containing protein [Streptomyces sp. NPDC060030]|uniref:SIS domain-containing protein n=1 Tax=Streptomyces sp. NPDC060030 TaxID=3347042 RepID=UPI00367DE3A5